MRVLEELDDVGILDADLLQILVLLLVHILEFIVADEFRHAVRGHVPGLGYPDFREKPLLSRGPLQDVLREEEPRALAPQASVARGGVDDVRGQVKEVGDTQVSFGDVDEAGVVRKEPSDQRDLEPLLGGGGEEGLAGRQGPVAEDGVDDRAQRRIAGVHGFDQEAQFVLLNPHVQAGENLLLVQMTGCDGKHLIACREHVLPRLLLLGTIGFGHPIRLVPRQIDSEHVQDLAGFVDPAPKQVVEHLARGVEVELLVAAAEQVYDDPPLGLGWGGQAVVRCLSLDQKTPQSPVVDGLTDTVCDRPDELAFLLQKQPFGRGGHLLDIGDLDKPDRLALHPDRRRVLPRRLDVPRRLEDSVLTHELGLTELGILPTAGDGRDQVSKDVGQRAGLTGQQLLHLVEAVQFLGPFPQHTEGVGFLVLVTHSYRRVRL